MSVDGFITEKSKQLEFYIRGYWDAAITYHELQQFLWDTLEEWGTVENSAFVAYSHQERVFWHVFFVVQHTEEEDLKYEDQNPDLAFVLEFLNRNYLCPLDVVGMRP
ncbi:hypothetical protein [Glaciecola sp. 1036]|uniref:hypothetical protein n=1 Tax=Alteromonadaceae TaxID=72275 RepID=UPI003D04A315